ncbi:NDR1/HIN1-like protein [Solilutibacter tolerans]|nr:LEA type 2 family protein [Lysobacter tolerans]
MMKILRTGLFLALALLISACSSTGPRRVSEPAASIQQLTVDANGGWQVRLRLQNYSSIAMRFDSVDVAVTAGGASAGQLQASPALNIAPESADVIDITLRPSAEARLQVADALASGRGLTYTLNGNLVATPDKGKVRTFRISRDSALSPTPGLPGVLR